MGTWIEIAEEKAFCFSPAVVPYVGTWIEIDYGIRMQMLVLHVVPYVGTWIEMRSSFFQGHTHPVVPYVGTWIEIDGEHKWEEMPLSFPTWERG